VSSVSRSRGPPAAQEIVHGRSKKFHSTDSRPNQDGALALGNLLKEDQKRTDDGCWFCAGQRKMACSHLLLHCQSANLVAARTKAWDDRDPEVLLANPRWKKRLLRFLELSGVGRVDADGTDEDEAWARKMDNWIVWEVREEAVRG
jgi:hypothetical protein